MNNLQGFKVNTRPTRTHWANGRPPVQLSIPALESQLYVTGNQEDTRTILQYSGNDKVKLMVDCDNYSCSDLPAAEAFAKVKEVVLVPLLAFITAKTGKVVSLDELCVESACRKQKPINNVPRSLQIKGGGFTMPSNCHIQVLPWCKVNSWSYHGKHVWCLGTGLVMP